MIHLDYVWLFKIYENKDENGHRFSLSSIIGELREKEKKREWEREQQIINKI